jgi:hypothetical protein
MLHLTVLPPCSVGHFHRRRVQEAVLHDVKSYDELCAAVR